MPSITSKDINAQKKQLRHQIRIARNKLSPLDQDKHAKQLSDILSETAIFNSASKIAMYCAADGEISLQYLMNKARAGRKTCYLPRIDGKEMVFCECNHETALVKNQYGISEPSKEANVIEAKQLDLVLLPLVAFDTKGQRLGMGGGFYDRCFAFRQYGASAPALIGVAHALQQQKDLPTENWDIALDGIATEKAYLELKAV